LNDVAEQVFGTKPAQSVQRRLKIVGNQSDE
jgi:hypothetical protein